MYLCELYMNFGYRGLPPQQRLQEGFPWKGNTDVAVKIFCVQHKEETTYTKSMENRNAVGLELIQHINWGIAKYQSQYQEW